MSVEPTPGADPVVASLRDQIDAVDLELLDAVNRRLGIVRDLHHHKQAHAYPLYDAGREASLLERLRAANSGPLSDEGVRILFEHVIELTRRELHGA